jgi:hypothetical protein
MFSQPDEKEGVSENQEQWRIQNFKEGVWVIVYSNFCLVYGKYC